MPPAPATTEEMQTTSAESLALSKGLKKKGFAFVGPTTMFALMEAIGVFDPHLVGCFRRRWRPLRVALHRATAPVQDRLGVAGRLLEAEEDQVVGRGERLAVVRRAHRP